MPLAVVAWVGLAWVGSATGTCRPELRQKLLDHQLRTDEMQELCGQDEEESGRTGAVMLQAWSDLQRIIHEGLQEVLHTKPTLQSCSNNDPMQQAQCQFHYGMTSSHIKAVVYYKISEMIRGRSAEVDAAVTTLAGDVRTWFAEVGILYSKAEHLGFNAPPVPPECDGACRYRVTAAQQSWNAQLKAIGEEIAAHCQQWQMILKKADEIQSTLSHKYQQAFPSFGFRACPEEG